VSIETAVTGGFPEQEGPLGHLPCSGIVEYRKGKVIYNLDQPSTGIYLVVSGKVKVSRVAEDGHQTVVDIYQPDEFFGEGSLSKLLESGEQAVTLENTKLMTWSPKEIREIIMMQPGLAMALMQIFIQRTIDFTKRIESLSLDKVPSRLGRTLIRFSERFGTVEEDGSVRMVPFTHQLLSEYVGTTREIVTRYMNQFRQQGYIRFSRKSILLYPKDLKEWLKQNQ
jgi:CRP/FNR family cyclic AMP-dependent transcriptional regulator